MTPTEISQEEFLKMVHEYFMRTEDVDFEIAYRKAGFKWLNLPEYWKTYLDEKLGVNRVIDVRYLKIIK